MDRARVQALIDEINVHLIAARQEREKEIDADSDWTNSFVCGAAYAWDKAFELVTKYAREND